MTETTTTTSTAVAKGANKAANKLIDTVASASEHTFPTVVETAEVALELPSKVVLNQRLVVIVTALAAGGIGAGAVIGWQKFQERRSAKKDKVEIEALVASNTKN